MAIPNEALQKMLQEIETQAIMSLREIGMVKSGIASKQREIRLIELTSSELKSLPENTNIYEGVGKMFVHAPKPEVSERLISETYELKSDITNLNKKLHYLETTHKNSKERIDQILGKASGR